MQDLMAGATAPAIFFGEYKVPIEAIRDPIRRDRPVLGLLGALPGTSVYAAAG
jgi:hypothetical protein